MTNETNNTNTSTANDDHPVIKCDGVYKIFGENTKDMMAKANGNIDVEAFKEAGCIFGVNNASIEVSKGEMLVVMGLSCVLVPFTCRGKAIFSSTVLWGSSAKL